MPVLQLMHRLNEFDLLLCLHKGQFWGYVTYRKTFLTNIFIVHNVRLMYKSLCSNSLHLLCLIKQQTRLDIPASSSQSFLCIVSLPVFVYYTVCT